MKQHIHLQESQQLFKPGLIQTGTYQVPNSRHQCQRNQ